MNRISNLGKFLIVAFCTLGISLSSNAQNSNDAREVTNTYFVKNAFVVQKPGTILPNTSILIKDGLISDIGANIKPPYDAKVIEADSMYVYAGFIDACSHAGIKKPESKDRVRVDNPGNPPLDLAGITPQNTVRSAIKGNEDKSLKELKELGFGFVHVVPHGRMLPGQGSILSTGSTNVEESLIKENVSQFFQFRSARGMFPGTTIGVMSQLRDLFKNANYQSKYAKSYNANPVGLQKPSQSNEILALVPAANGKQPMYSYTPKVKDINRAMILQKELGYNMVLTGVRQGWPLLKDIKSGRFPVVLSLHLPKKIEDAKKDGGEDKMKKDGGEKKKKKEKDEEEETLEMKELKARKKASHDKYVGQPSLFEKNGIAFSFSTLDTKSGDIKANLLRMIEGGLSERAALSALTTNPANLLGISNIAGTIEKGKMANLFITDTLYFTEDSKIKYIINDGTIKETKEEKKKKGGAAGDGLNLEGEWAFSVEVPGETQSGTIKITGTGDDMDIEVDDSSEPGDYVKADNINVDENELSFDLNIEGMTYSISVEVEGDAFEGSVSVGEFGTFPMTGTKKDPKN